MPAGGDPFLIAYWLRHFRTWAGEVDELRIAVCGQDDPAIRAYLASLATDKVVMTFHPRTDHGAMIRYLVEATAAEFVMLCEDDAFVRRPGAVDGAFGRVERGAMVACPRASGTPGVIDAANRRFGVLAAENGEQGPIFWPCFWFGRRADLLATDRNFGAAAFPEGERNALLDWTPPERNAMDTFGWASLQLRAMNLSVTVEAQYRAQRDLMASWDSAQWFHVGSLSSGYGLYLLGPIRQEDRQGHWNAIRNDLYDWEKRMSWWQRVHERWDGALPEHHAAYGEAIRDYFAGTGMDQGAVNAWRAGFDHMVTWAE